MKLNAKAQVKQDLRGKNLDKVSRKHPRGKGLKSLFNQ